MWWGNCFGRDSVIGGKAAFKPQASVRLSAPGPPFLFSLSQGPSGGAGWRAGDRWTVKPRLEWKGESSLQGFDLSARVWFSSS